MRANLILFILFPVFIWRFVILVIINAVKGNFKNSPGHRAVQSRTASAGRSFTKQRPTVKMSYERPQMQKGLFDMDLSKGKTARKEKTLSGGGMFSNTDFEDWSAKGRKKDFVSGYDRKLQTNRASQRRARGMQYSHTYDGHEPWDKCLPKEKDPWDKDFYA